MDKVTQLKNLSDAAYTFYEQAIRLRIVIENNYVQILDERAKGFSEATANIMKLIAELIADKGFKISFDEPAEDASLNKFLDKACAEATERGKNWE